jgi:hypothetical protein
MVDKQFPSNAVAGVWANTHACMITNQILLNAWDEA